VAKKISIVGTLPLFFHDAIANDSTTIRRVIQVGDRLSLLAISRRCIRQYCENIADGISTY
jgi:hypothetical protein